MTDGAVAWTIWAVGCCVGALNGSPMDFGLLYYLVKYGREALRDWHSQEQ